MVRLFFIAFYTFLPTKKQIFGQTIQQNFGNLNYELLIFMQSNASLPKLLQNTYLICISVMIKVDETCCAA